MEPPTKITLLVGFDSAWTATNSGGIVGALHFDIGTFQSRRAPEADSRKMEKAGFKLNLWTAGALACDDKFLWHRHSCLCIAMSTLHIPVCQ